MFTEHLTQPERGALRRLLVWLAAVDGDVAPREAAAIAQAAERLQLPAEAADLVFGAAGLDALCAVIERPSAQRIILAELVALAHADDDFRFVEKRALGALATRFGLGPAELDRIERWVDAGLKWKADAREVLLLDSP